MQLLELLFRNSITWKARQALKESSILFLHRQQTIAGCSNNWLSSCGGRLRDLRSRKSDWWFTIYHRRGTHSISPALCVCVQVACARPEKPQRGCSIADFKQKSAQLLQPVSSVCERWNHDEQICCAAYFFSTWARRRSIFSLLSHCLVHRKMYLFLDWLTALIIHLQAITALQKNRRERAPLSFQRERERERRCGTISESRQGHVIKNVALGWCHPGRLVFCLRSTWMRTLSASFLATFRELISLRVSRWQIRCSLQTWLPV